ncbi:MAG: TolC family protein [Myxococcales bacterium]|nr:MAG: TolC family protein [Myxococcales bacterium]
MLLSYIRGIYLVVCGLLFVPSRVQAEALRFEEAVGLVQHASAVKSSSMALETRRDSDDGIGGTAGPMQFSFMPGFRPHPAESKGFEFQANFSESFSLEDLGGARRESAKKERQAIAAEVQANLLSSRLEIARAWLALWRIEKLRGMAADATKLTETFLSAIERAQKLGEATVLDVESARSHLAELKMKSLDLEGMQFYQVLKLCETMGRKPNTKLTTKGDPPRVALPKHFDTPSLIARVDALPSVQYARLLRDSAKARVSEADASVAPMFQIGAQVQRESPTSWLGFGLVGISVPVSNAAKRQVSQHLEEVERLNVAKDKARRDGQAQLLAAIHEVEHETRLLRLVTKEALPSVTNLVDAQEKALAANEGSVFQLVTARRQWIATRELSTLSQEALSWAKIKLWLLMKALHNRGSSK